MRNGFLPSSLPPFLFVPICSKLFLQKYRNMSLSIASVLRSVPSAVWSLASQLQTSLIDNLNACLVWVQKTHGIALWLIHRSHILQIWAERLVLRYVYAHHIKHLATFKRGVSNRVPHTFDCKATEFLTSRTIEMPIISCQCVKCRWFLFGSVRDDGMLWL